MNYQITYVQSQDPRDISFSIFTLILSNCSHIVGNDGLCALMAQHLFSISRFSLRSPNICVTTYDGWMKQRKWTEHRNSIWAKCVTALCSQYTSLELKVNRKRMFLFPGKFNRKRYCDEGWLIPFGYSAKPHYLQICSLWFRWRWIMKCFLLTSFALQPYRGTVPTLIIETEEMKLKRDIRQLFACSNHSSES